MSTRVALIVSLVSIMFTLWVGTHPKEQKLYMVATVSTPRSATLETDQRSANPNVAIRREHKSRSQCRKGRLQR